MGIDAMAIAEGYASSCPQSPAVLVKRKTGIGSSQKVKCRVGSS
jgi:hypothetical protein